VVRKSPRLRLVTTLIAKIGDAVCIPLILVGDSISLKETLRNAVRLVREGGTLAVTLEGGITVPDKIKGVVECGISVMGHLGLTS
jgi:hypothetical protein